MSVSVSELKAQLAKYLRAARQGRSIEITDRGQPVARLVPIAREVTPPRLALSQPRDPAAPPLGALRVQAIRWRGPNTTELLRDDRDGR